MKKYLIATIFSLQILFASNCYESSITKPSPFMGNNGEIFQLTDGSLWEVKYSYEYLYEYYPQVVICPDNSKLIIKGKNINVKSLSSKATKNNYASETIETRIDGNFEGWNGNRYLNSKTVKYGNNQATHTIIIMLFLQRSSSIKAAVLIKCKSMA